MRLYTAVLLGPGDHYVVKHVDVETEEQLSACLTKLVVEEGLLPVVVFEGHCQHVSTIQDSILLERTT